jgi:4-amino-4-deoxy-L-arabinose transferase-like glycosyltransferase
MFEMFLKVSGRFQEWRSGKGCLFFLLFLSLAIKCTLLFSDEVINVSGVRYVEAAQQFAEGNFREGLNIEKMPFYPMLICAFRFLVRDWELSAQLISLFAMVGALVPIYWLTKDLFDEKVAFWTGLVFVLSPVLNGYAVDVIRDPIFLFFVAWAVYFFWRALRVHKSHFFALSSVSSVLAMLCRIEGVLLFGVFGAILLALAIKNEPERFQLLKGMALMVGLPLAAGLVAGGVGMLVAGKELVSFSRLGEPLARLRAVLNGDFLDMYHHIYEQFKAYENPRYVWSYGSFADTARHYLPLIYLISVAETVAKNLFPLFVLPLLAGFRKRPTLHRGHWLILLLAGTYFLVGYYFLFTHDFIAKRYVLIPALLLFPWVGRGLARMWSGISGSPWPRISVIFFLLIFLGIPFFKSLDVFWGGGKGGNLREAGQWLSRQPEFQNAVIACSDPRVRFYSSENLIFPKVMENAHVARDFGKMESVAIENAADLLVIEVSKNNRKRIPEFHDFELLKKFAGNINDVLVYGRKG